MELAVRTDAAGKPEPSGQQDGRAGLVNADVAESLPSAEWLEVLPIGVAILDHEMRFLGINQRLADINGVPRVDHLGRRADEVLPDVDPGLFEVFREVLASGVGREGIAVSGVTGQAPGVTRHWRENVQPLLVDGRVGAIVVSVEEITEQQRALESLEAANAANAALARFAALLARVALEDEVAGSILAGAVTVSGAQRAALFRDRDGPLRLADALGFPDEVLASLREAVPQDSPVGFVAHTLGPLFLPSLHAIGERFQGSEALAEASGDRAVAIVPLLGDERLVGVLHLGYGEPRPFTTEDRERLLVLGSLAAQALDRADLFHREARGRRLLEEVVRQMPVGVSITDQSGALITNNPAIEAIWRGTRHAEGIEDYEEWRGFHPDGRPYDAHEWPLARSLEHGEVVVDELIDIERFDRTRGVISLSSAPVHHADGSVMAAVGVVLDVTAARQADLAREAFISVLSHELRTPLTSIVAGLAILASRRDLDDGLARSVVVDLQEEAARLERIIEDVLVLSRLERGVEMTRQHPVSVRQVIREVCMTEQRQHPSLELSVEIEPDLPIATGDETFLAQVLRNLIANAAKYGGGQVWVRAIRAGTGVAVEVEDDGPGIDPGDRDRVFELFFRSARHGQVAGSGIGLFACRGLMQAMGGTIELTDGRGSGACLRAWLPTLDEEIAGSE